MANLWRALQDEVNIMGCGAFGGLWRFTQKLNLAIKGKILIFGVTLRIWYN